MFNERPLVVLFAAMLVLSACSSSSDTPGAHTSESASPPAAPRTPSPSPSDTGTPSHAPETAPLPEAADGKDYAACSDGKCQVRAGRGAEIIIEKLGGPYYLVVQDVDDGALVMHYSGAIGSVSTGSDFAPVGVDSGQVWLEENGAITFNDQITVALDGVRGNESVFSVSP